MDFLELLELLNRLTMSRKHQKIRKLCRSNSPQEWAQDSASPLITLLVVSSEYTAGSSKGPAFQCVSTQIVWKQRKLWSKLSSGALERLCESFLQRAARSLIKAETWQGAVGWLLSAPRAQYPIQASLNPLGALPCISPGFGQMLEWQLAQELFSMPDTDEGAKERRQFTGNAASQSKGKTWLQKKKNAPNVLQIWFSSKKSNFTTM